MREFNITGVCVPNMHYMIDTSNKIDEINKLIDKGSYFTINRARQYGKTTVLNQLYKLLRDKYLVIKISFEGIGDKPFSSETSFCESLVSLISKRLKQNKVSDKIIYNWEENKDSLEKFEDLSNKITRLIKDINKDVILMIDEVDKSSNNQLFLNFLGMLRTKYLDRTEGLDITFKSVILAGVYDIKNLKLKLRTDEERKYNSPWNIATNFTIDLSFNPEEIGTMLIDYEEDAKTGMHIEEISKIIYGYTSGYPFLVSRLCKTIEEELSRNWTKEGIEDAVKKIVKEQNTLFDDIIKNIENNKELDNLVSEILMDGIEFSYVHTDPIINIGIVLGLLSETENGKVKIHNKVFELLLYNHLSIRQERKRTEIKKHLPSSQFIDDAGDLKIEHVLNKFQELMKEEYRDKTKEFVEKEGRLIFLAFIKPIINGTGFYFIESETRDNMRLDIVITFNKKQYIIELKKWYGKEYEEKGYNQLANYLKVKNIDKGYIVLFDFRKVKKEYIRQWVDVNIKSIYEVVV